MFSVIIPLYNKELSIQSTIQSVLDQSFQDFEIVIVNDGSTDKSVEGVEKFNEPRIRIVHQENQGVSAARNKGIEKAQFEWIAFIDADDLWKENHLSEITEMMRLFPNEKVYATSFEFSDKREIFRLTRNKLISRIDDYFEEVQREQLIWTGIVVIHKKCFNKLGKFNIKLNRGEDLEMWTRIARHFSLIKSCIITATYRIEAENRSISNFNLLKSNVFNYSFINALSKSEINYYKRHIIKTLRHLLKNGNFIDFYRLRQKHNTHIKYLDIFLTKY